MTIQQYLDKRRLQLKGFFTDSILYQGNWVTWEFYKDLKKIDEHGHIGDMINGETVYVTKYKYFFEKELINFISETEQGILRMVREVVEFERVSFWGDEHLENQTRINNTVVNNILSALPAITK